MDMRLKFDEDAANYDQWRPRYCDKLFEDVIGYSGINSDKSAVEIGCGTGQATEPFLKTGCSVIAVELGKQLASFTKNKFAKYSNFHVENVAFEEFQHRNDSIDLVYSATAFHWIPQEVGYTKVFNLLKSGGVMALFWNHPSRTDEELDFAMQEVYNKYKSTNESTIHRFSEEKCLEIAETIRKYGFVDVGYKLYYQTRFFDAPQYMSLLNTNSDHRARREETRILIENELSNVINNFGGKIEIKDTIDLYLARKP